MIISNKNCLFLTQFSLFSNKIVFWGGKMKITLKLLEDNSEVIQSYLPYTRIGIQCNKLSYFDEMRALCHWHEDIELTKIIDGEMNYYVNGKTYLLKKGDGILINAKAMHYGYSSSGKDCDFICVLISPSILGENTALFHQFIEPIIHTKTIDAYILSEVDNNHKTILSCIEQYGELYKKHMNTKENIDFDCISLACYFWKNWYLLIKDKINSNEIEHHDIVLQKKMTNFIYQNYMHPIKLEDIASSANICRNKCCQLFKKYAQQSPILFLNAYRIEKAKDLLINSSLNITEIALNCGFNNLSYFAKQFSQVTKCSPKHYRKLLIQKI